MIHLNHNYYFKLKSNGRVFMRVRWNSGKSETSMALSVLADPQKWDKTKQRAIRNTNHEVGGAVFNARSINNAIEKAIDVVDQLFQEYGLRNVMPTVEQVKEKLCEIQQEKTKAVAESLPQEAKKLSFKMLYMAFLSDYGSENNWAAKTHYKYQQTYKLLLAYKPKVELIDIDKKLLTGFKEWLVKNDYKNSSISKYFRCLRTMLHWMKDEEYTVNPEALCYRSKLSVPTKNVIHLTIDELQQFENFQFPKNKQYLAKARDLFCFMCYTSLRYSDLKGLKKAAIVDDTITTICQKTKRELHIPLVSHAVLIKNKYITQTPGENVFPVPSIQKLNAFIKEGARMAGLNREVIDTTFCGADRVETVMKLYEAISCHDARRSFVCIAFKLGIPQSVIMACTGHSNYTAMRPYVAISDETSRMELRKWDIGSVRNELNRLLDTMKEDNLSRMIEYAKSLIK